MQADSSARWLADMPNVGLLHFNCQHALMSNFGQLSVDGSRVPLFKYYKRRHILSSSQLKTGDQTGRINYTNKDSQYTLLYTILSLLLQGVMFSD